MLHSIYNSFFYSTVTTNAALSNTYLMSVHVRLVAGGVVAAGVLATQLRRHITLFLVPINSSLYLVFVTRVAQHHGMVPHVALVCRLVTALAAARGTRELGSSRRTAPRSPVSRHRGRRSNWVLEVETGDTELNVKNSFIEFRESTLNLHMLQALIRDVGQNKRPLLHDRLADQVGLVHAGGPQPLLGLDVPQCSMKIIHYKLY